MGGEKIQNAYFFGHISQGSKYDTVPFLFCNYFLINLSWSSLFISMAIASYPNELPLSIVRQTFSKYFKICYFLSFCSVLWVKHFIQTLPSEVLLRYEVS